MSWKNVLQSYRLTLRTSRCLTRSEAEAIAERYLEQHSFVLPPILILECGQGWAFRCVPPEPMIGGVFAILVEPSGAIREVGVGAIWERIVYPKEDYERPTLLCASAEARSAALFDRIVASGRVDLLDVLCAERFYGGDVLMIASMEKIESLKLSLLKEGFPVSMRELSATIQGRRAAEQGVGVDVALFGNERV